MLISGYHGKYWSVRSMKTAILKCELLAVEVMYIQLIPYPGFPQPLILKYELNMSCEARLTY